MAENLGMDGHRTLTPYLKVRGVAQAIEFYKKAFGAREKLRMPVPGSDKIMHAQLLIGDSELMMTDESKEWNVVSPLGLGGTSVTIHMYVPDVDATFAQAVAAGATANMPPMDMFWGDRFAKVTDPFGHEWSIATVKEKLTVEQMRERSVEAFKQMKPK
jgi:uncharacterized glyoxalase superfamily protein PhnB